MLFDFLMEDKFVSGKIDESKAFRNEDAVRKYSEKELSEILFTMMLALHLLSQTKFNSDAKKYAEDSLKFPLFDKIYLSATDMANITCALRNAKDILNERDVNIPVMELKRYLRTGFSEGNMSDSLKRMLFIKLQNNLKINNSSLTTLRRNIVDSYNLNWSFKKKYGEQLYQQLRKYQYKCDILYLLQKFMEATSE